MRTITVKQLLAGLMLLIVFMALTDVTYGQIAVSPSAKDESLAGIDHPNADNPDVNFDSRETASSATRDLMRKPPYLIYTGDYTEIQILWQLTGSATSTIEWGLDTTYSLGSAQTSEYGSNHQHTYTITGLMPSTKYYYRITEDNAIYTGTFRSAPDPNATAVKFMAYGDTRTFPYFHNQVAGQMIATYTADQNFQSLIVVVGDLVTNGDSETDWDDEFFASGYANINEMLANVPYNSAMGNHEGSGQLFVKYFPYPFVAGRYWSYDYGPAHFVVVDQYTPYGPGSAQLQWIENDLATTTKQWKFIYLHEPGWSAGGIGGHENNTMVQDYIQPLCEQYGVSIVFAGHNHYYARAVVNGVQHITTGGGGAPLTLPFSWYPYIVSASMSYHFCKVEINDNMLYFAAVNTSGSVIDDFTLELLPPVSVTLTPYNPPIVIPASGGSFDFNIAVANNNPWSETFDLWTMVTLPNSSEYGPILGPYNLTMSAGASINRDRNQTVPAGAPAGNYTYDAYVGLYPNDIWDEDHFGFEKLTSGGADGLLADWENSGEGFEEWFTSSQPETQIPGGYFLGQNYPNPFNPTTTITFALPKAGQTKLNIYDAAGHLLTTLVDGWRVAGYHEVTFDGSTLASGVYLYQLKSGEFKAQGKMVMIK